MGRYRGRTNPSCGVPPMTHQRKLLRGYSACSDSNGRQRCAKKIKPFLSVKHGVPRVSGSNLVVMMGLPPLALAYVLIPFRVQWLLLDPARRSVGRI